MTDTPGYASDRPTGSNAAPGRTEHPWSTAVLVLGIVGIFIGPAAVAAWYMGHRAHREILKGAPWPYDGKLQAGKMLGMVFSILWIVGLLGFLALFISVGMVAIDNPQDVGPGMLLLTGLV